MKFSERLLNKGPTKYTPEQIARMTQEIQSQIAELKRRKEEVENNIRSGLFVKNNKQALADIENKLQGLNEKLKMLEAKKGAN